MKFPQGATIDAFVRQMSKHTGGVLTGKMLAVDPSSGGSSEMGYAVFRSGDYQFSGVVPVNHAMPVDKRLRVIGKFLGDLGTFDVAVVEAIRGKAHRSLVYSVGACMACVRTEFFVELPICIWKAVAGDMHEKGDEADAKAIGFATIAVVEGLTRKTKGNNAHNI